MDAYKLRAIISTRVRMDNAAKQRAGQAYAKMLGLTPGKSGRDNLLDGYGKVGDHFIYFQCKLSQNPLGAEYADSFYAGLERHEAQIGIMLAGVGYIERGDLGFLPRLQGYPRIKANIFTYHLLTVEDILTKSTTFLSALDDLPQLDIIRNELEK
ncbi:MAG: restriction endonuclease [Planktothrix sp.]